MEKIKLLKKERNRYKLAYGYLMEYWDSIDTEQQKILDKKLKRLGL